MTDSHFINISTYGDFVKYVRPLFLILEAYKVKNFSSVKPYLEAVKSFEHNGLDLAKEVASFVLDAEEYEIVTEFWAETESASDYQFNYIRKHKSNAEHRLEKAREINNRLIRIVTEESENLPSEFLESEIPVELKERLEDMVCETAVHLGEFMKDYVKVFRYGKK